MDFRELKHMKGLIAAATAILLLTRSTRPRADLSALATLSFLVYLNFFAFHGERTFVHLHDVAHYYLRANYYAELRHADLYTAMLRAASCHTPAPRALCC